jgi:hypothetical protein
LQGRFGQAEPSEAKNEISGSVPVARAWPIHWSIQSLSCGFSATFHDGK